MPKITEVEHGASIAETGDTTSTPSFIQDGKVDWNRVPKDARFEIEVQGQPVVVTGERVKDMLSMGYRFSDRMREVTQKELELERAYEPMRKLDEHLKANPRVRKLVKAVVQNDVETLQREFGASRAAAARGPAPGFTAGEGGDGNDGAAGNEDFYLAQINDLKSTFERQMSTLREQLSEAVGGVTGSVQTLTARAADAEAVQLLKTDRRFARLASDDNIALAREHQRRFGGDLVSAFQLATWDKLPAIVEQDVVERYGIEKERFEMPGASSPISGGIVLDDKTMAALFEDPDELAKHANAIRAHRRRISGKQRHPMLPRR